MIDPRCPDYADVPGGPRRPRFGYARASEGSSPLATILTPFFNAGDRFRETARCVFGQSLQDFEWIIVNDRSTDPQSLAVLDEVRADPRVRVIDLPENSGPGAARNAGFRAARTDFIYQLDADDLIEPTCVEKCWWFLLRHPEYAFCHTYEVGFGAQQYLWAYGFHTSKMFLSECPVGSHTVMVRRSAHEAVGGYDESIRAGMEDWEFFLRAADSGHWGATMAEYLAWYRRRSDHGAHWADWDGADRQKAFLARLREKMPGLFGGDKPFPHPPPRWATPYERVERDGPPAARLAKKAPRLLLIAPWLRMGGSDKFNLDMVGQLASRGWEVTIATTIRGAQTWMPEFSAITPDVFVLHHFLRPIDHPWFLRYLVESRRPDAVMVSNSELGYLALPYLRSTCPGPAYVDYIHMEETYWKNGGYPRYSVGAQDQLDLTIVSSNHLRNWMSERGGDAARIDVVNTNIDPQVYAPDPEDRQRVRAELGIEPDAALILFAGRLTAQKQPRVLAETLRRVAERDAKFTAIIVGEGEDKPFLAQFIRQHGLSDRVRLMGEATSKRVRQLLNASDIFFLPSLWEGIALVLFEAMSLGVAFVGARVGGQGEVLTEGCGVLIDRSNDPQDEIERYTEELCRLLTDPDARQRMGRAARERICALYTLDRMGDEIVKSLERAISLSRERPRERVPAGLAHELADRGVEYLRVADVADWLWTEREKGRSTSSAPIAEARPQPMSTPGSSAVFEELLRIESSRSFRFIQKAKKTAPYRAFARIRYGESAMFIEPVEDPAARLARIKDSRAFRLIESLKRSILYDLYARRRYGPDWKRTGRA